MTLDEVRRRVAALTENAGGDPENDHSLRDGLYIGVLREVASGNPDSLEMVTEALKVEDLGLTLWFA